MTRLAKLKKLKDYHAISDDEFEPATSTLKGKRVRKTITAKTKPKRPTQMSYTVDKILHTWNEESEYGRSFRGMSCEEQQLEIVRMNKGAEKDLKTQIKTKLLDVNYKVLLSEKMRGYLNESRTPMARIYHSPPYCFIPDMF